jgi:hypothetical protein
MSLEVAETFTKDYTVPMADTKDVQATVVRFADVPPPPMPPTLAPMGTISGLATRSAVVRMVPRQPLRRPNFSARTWCRHNRLLLALLVGASMVGVVVTFYVSAFYGYKPAYYEPKDGRREIQIKQMELQELQRKQLERDHQATSPAP